MKVGTHFECKALWNGDVNTSYIEVTPEGGEALRLGWREVFPSDIPEVAWPPPMTIFVEFPVTPEEVELRVDAVEIARMVYGKMNESIGRTPRSSWAD